MEDRRDLTPGGGRWEPSSTSRAARSSRTRQGYQQPSRPTAWQAGRVSDARDEPDTDALAGPAGLEAVRDLAEVPAVEVVSTLAVHLMTAAAIRCGLGDGPDAAAQIDLAEARILITALAGLVGAAAPYLGSQHAAPLRDGLAALQRAFREASPIPDAPGEGPGERLSPTGAAAPTPPA